MSKETSFCSSCGLPITKTGTVWTHNDSGKKHPAFPVDNHIKGQANIGDSPLASEGDYTLEDKLKWFI